MLYYVPFFGGVIEISSIPLQIVDIYHPKHFKEWAETPFGSRMNAIARPSFIVLFLFTRTLYFPYVTLVQVLPDFYHVAQKRPEEWWWCFSGGFLCTSFMFLQLYWSYMIYKQVSKLL